MLALAGMGIVNGTAADAATRVTGAAAATPPDYSIAFANLSLPNGVQTSGSVKCPVKKGVHTVPLSGGAFLETASFDATISSSFPLANGWSVDVNNTSGAAAQFAVYAVCMKKPKAYVQQQATFPVSTDSQTNVGATCPKGDVLLGGGARAGSSSLLVTLNSSYPGGTNTWFVTVNNPLPSSTDVSIFRVCGKISSRSDYEIFAAPSVDNPAGQVTETDAECPGGQSVLAGGIRSSGGLYVSINTSFPIKGVWSGAEGNASISDASVDTIVLCAF
jgi:hypothetical protein